MGNANNEERFRKSSLQDQMILDFPVASATLIAKGDFVLLWAGSAIQPDDLGSSYNSLAAAQRDAARLFAGMALDESAAGSTAKIRVDVSPTAIYECDQETAGAVSIGDYFSIHAESAAGTGFALSNQELGPITCSWAIMQCVAEKTSTTSTKVLCKMVQNRFYNQAHHEGLTTISWPNDTCNVESDPSYAG